MTTLSAISSIVFVFSGRCGKDTVGFIAVRSIVEDRLGRDLGYMGEPLLVQTPFADTVFDLSKVDKYDIALTEMTMFYPELRKKLSIKNK